MVACRSIRSSWLLPFGQTVYLFFDRPPRLGIADRPFPDDDIRHALGVDGIQPIKQLEKFFAAVRRVWVGLSQSTFTFWSLRRPPVMGGSSLPLSASHHQLQL